MLERHLSGLPVVEDGRLVGMVTEKDLVAKHAQVHLPTYFSILGTVLPLGRHRTDEEIRHVLGVTARDLMSEDLVTVEVARSVDEAATLMVEHDVNPLPVMDGDRLVGILSHSDIIRLLLTEEEDGDADASS
jgi:CBS domain-containing protein